MADTRHEVLERNIQPLIKGLIKHNLTVKGREDDAASAASRREGLLADGDGGVGVLGAHGAVLGEGLRQL